jgi:hypothetical protein
MDLIADKDWPTYRDPYGFSLKHPVGWQVVRHPAGGPMVTSPDGNAFVAIEEAPQPVPASAAEILRRSFFQCSSSLTRRSPATSKIRNPAWPRATLASASMAIAPGSRF